MPRFTFEIPQLQLDDLDELAELTGMPTKREYLNSALTLMDWAVRQIANGHEIAAIASDGTVARQIDMPALSAVRRNAVAARKFIAGR